MENLLNIIQNNLYHLELIAYFSCEILFIIGVIINVLMFLFLNRKYNIKRISDLITFDIFTLNSIILSSILIKNHFSFGEIDHQLLDGTILVNSETIFIKLLLNIFLSLFIIVTYKTTRKVKFKTTLTNSSLLLLALVSSILAHIQGYLFSFILFDLCAFLIYKFASNSRIKKSSVYCIDFILMNIISTALFFTFYFLSFSFAEKLPLAIIQVGLCCAIFLKGGLFPIYNYTLNKHTKNNISYSILLYSFLPLLCLITFSKIMPYINYTNEVFYVTITLFLSMVIFTSTLNIIKSKNIIKYLAYFSYCIFSFYLIAMLSNQEISTCINNGFIFLFTNLTIYSLLCIVKINTKPDKLNIKLLKGSFIKNRFFITLFSISLLILANVIPTIFLLKNLDSAKIIYLFDEINFYIVGFILLMFIINTIFILKVIKLCYTQDKTNINIKYTKRTMPNYIVPIVIILFLIIKMFL